MQGRLPVLILSTQVLLRTLINPNHPDILYPDVPSLSTLRNFSSPLLRGHLQVLSPSSSLQQKELSFPNIPLPLPTPHTLPYCARPLLSQLPARTHAQLSVGRGPCSESTVESQVLIGMSAPE